MKKRSLLVIVIVLLALLLWWLLRIKTWPSASNVSLVTEPASQQPTDVTNPAVPSKPALVPAPQRDKLEFLRDLAQQSNRPIRFYGKVIDQDEKPIPDVRVKLAIRTAKEPITGLVSDVFDYQIMTTDAQGQFTITDAKGALLEVKSLEKPGYEASIKKINQAYWYWRDPSQVFKPDPEAPEVFRMWKRAGAEKLLRKGISVPLRYDGTPSTLDLTNGRAGSSGDLRVTLVRDPQQITYGQRNYEWTLTIESLGGGLIETNDEQMYRAPTEGYQPKLIVHMPANASDWADEKQLNLYVKLHGGQQYARAELKALVGSDRESTPFYITSYINPSGSRNLEYDPTQDINKPPLPKPATVPTP